MIPELHACGEAEDFFAALEVGFDPVVLEAHRLPILRRFGELLVEISERHRGAPGAPGTDDAALRPLVRAALQEAYHAGRLGKISPRGGAATSCTGCALVAACAP
jgi:hypothetical protein